MLKKETILEYIGYLQRFAVLIIDALILIAMVVTSCIIVGFLHYLTRDKVDFEEILWHFICLLTGL